MGSTCSTTCASNEFANQRPFNMLSKQSNVVVVENEGLLIDLKDEVNTETILQIIFTPKNVQGMHELAVTYYARDPFSTITVKRLKFELDGDLKDEGIGTMLDTLCIMSDHFESDHLEISKSIEILIAKAVVDQISKDEKDNKHNNSNNNNNNNNDNNEENKDEEKDKSKKEKDNKPEKKKEEKADESESTKQHLSNLFLLRIARALCSDRQTYNGEQNIFTPAKAIFTNNTDSKNDNDICLFKIDESLVTRVEGLMQQVRQNDQSRRLFIGHCQKVILSQPLCDHLRYKVNVSKQSLSDRQVLNLMKQVLNDELSKVFDTIFGNIKVFATYVFLDSIEFDMFGNNISKDNIDNIFDTSWIDIDGPITSLLKRFNPSNTEKSHRTRYENAKPMTLDNYKQFEETVKHLINDGLFKSVVFVDTEQRFRMETPDLVLRYSIKSSRFQIGAEYILIRMDMIDLLWQAKFWEENHDMNKVNNNKLMLQFQSFEFRTGYIHEGWHKKHKKFIFCLFDSYFVFFGFEGASLLAIWCWGGDPFVEKQQLYLMQTKQSWINGKIELSHTTYTVNPMGLVLEVIQDDSFVIPNFALDDPYKEALKQTVESKEKNSSKLDSVRLFGDFSSTRKKAPKIDTTGIDEEILKYVLPDDE